MKDACDECFYPNFNEDFIMRRLRLLELPTLLGLARALGMLLGLGLLAVLVGAGDASETLMNSSIGSPQEGCSVICDIPVRSCMLLPTKDSFLWGSFLWSSMAKFLISAASLKKDQSVCVACADGCSRFREQEDMASACLMILKMKRQLGQQTFWKRSLGSTLSSSRLLTQGLREMGLREGVWADFSGVFVLKISDFSTTFSPFLRINLLSPTPPKMH